MGIVAILLLGPRPNLYTFYFPLPGGCIQHLIDIGSVVSLKKSCEMLTDNKQVTFGKGN